MSLPFLPLPETSLHRHEHSQYGGGIIVQSIDRREHPSELERIGETRTLDDL